MTVVLRNIYFYKKQNLKDNKFIYLYRKVEGLKQTNKHENIDPN